jgi:hypothetical protein
MTKAMYIPVDAPPRVVEYNGYDELKALVGGWIEGIGGDVGGSGTHVWSGYVDEEGKIKGLPVNDEATIFAGATGWYGAGSDVLCGPVVIIGPPDEEGDDTDVPQWLLYLADLAETES